MTKAAKVVTLGVPTVKPAVDSGATTKLAAPMPPATCQVLRYSTTTEPCESTAGRMKRIHRAPGVMVKMPAFATTLTVLHSPIGAKKPSSLEP